MTRDLWAMRGIIALLLVGSGVLARVCLPAPAPSQAVSLGEQSVAV